MNYVSSVLAALKPRKTERVFTWFLRLHVGHVTPPGTLKTRGNAGRDTTGGQCTPGFHCKVGRSCFFGGRARKERYVSSASSDLGYFGANAGPNVVPIWSITTVSL